RRRVTHDRHVHDGLQCLRLLRQRSYFARKIERMSGILVGQTRDHGGHHAWLRPLLSARPCERAVRITGRVTARDDRQDAVAPDDSLWHLLEPSESRLRIALR